MVAVISSESSRPDGVGPVLLRAARVGDAPVLAGLLQRSWSKAYEGLLPPSACVIAADEAVRGWVDRISSAAAHGSLQRLFVAEVAGQIVGWVSYGPPRAAAGAEAGASATPAEDAEGTAVGVVELYSLYVDPDLWGAGVGHTLLGHAMWHAQVLGCSAGQVWVLEGNARAVAAYERHGWRPSGARRRGVVRGVDVVEVEFLASW